MTSAFLHLMYIPNYVTDSLWCVVKAIAIYYQLSNVLRHRLDYLHKNMYILPLTISNYYVIHYLYWYLQFTCRNATMKETLESLPPRLGNNTALRYFTLRKSSPEAWNLNVASIFAVLLQQSVFAERIYSCGVQGYKSGFS